MPAGKFPCNTEAAKTNRAIACSQLVFLLTSFSLVSVLSVAKLFFGCGSKAAGAILPRTAFGCRLVVRIFAGRIMPKSRMVARHAKKECGFQVDRLGWPRLLEFTPWRGVER